MKDTPDLGPWIAFAAQRCGTPAEVPTELILALAQDVAHQVARPAVPVSAFLAGYLAGTTGTDAAAIIERLRVAAHEWED